MSFSVSPPPSPFVSRSYAFDFHEDIEQIAGNISYSSNSASSSSPFQESRLYSRSSGHIYTEQQRIALVSWATMVQSNAKNASKESLKALVTLGNHVPESTDDLPSLSRLIQAVKHVVSTNKYDASLSSIAREALRELASTFQVRLHSESPCRVAPPTPTIANFPILQLPPLFNLPSAVDKKD